ncbi:Transglycosylase SLT domain [uncultured Flavonifractor sp.]|nr:Transglycosylase SLT domain [uncultured Flavonifractor sp.]
MSQRKAKEYRRAMDQYHGVVEDVDDLKRRIGAIEARHRREDQAAENARRRARAAAREAQMEADARKKVREKEEREERRRRIERRRRELARRRIITLACVAVLLLAIVWAIATACMAQENEQEKEVTAMDPVVFVTPTIGEDPMEAEKIEEALLAQGYLSDAVPLSYDLQDIMRTACEEYGCPYSLALAVAEVESHFDMDAVGSAGEVGIMQLNPGPENTYWVNLEAETNQDPTTPAGNIVCGVYLLGAHLANYGDMEKAVMAYNMGKAGAERAWGNGVTSTDHSEKVMEAMTRWEAVVD